MDYSKKSKEELIAEIEFLKKREEGISLVLDNVDEMFYSISYDEKGNKNIEYVSPQVERVLGISKHDYINNPNLIIEHFHPEEIDKLLEESKKIKKGSEKWNATYRFYHKKLGKYVWIDENIVTVFDDDGNRKLLFGTARDVTQKVSQQRQLEFILENIDYCIYNVKFGKDGKILSYISDNVKDLTGLTPKEFDKEGKSGKLINRIHPDDVDMINKHIDDGLYAKRKRKIHTEFRFKPKGKKDYLWIEETVFTSYNKDGDIIETTTVLRDVTNRKSIETHLKENEEKYRNMFTKNMAGVFITEKGKIVECNNSFAKIFGYKSRVQLIGKPAESIYFSKSDRDNYIKELKKKGTLSNYRIRHKKKDGSELWILTNVTLYEDERVEGTLIEITDEVRHEELEKEKLRATIAEEANVVLGKEIEERKKIEKKLIQNQKYTRSIIDSSLDVIMASDVEGNIIEINNAGKQIFGYTEKEAYSNKASVFYATKDDFINVSKQLKKTGTYIGEVQNKRKNGDVFTSFLSASLLTDEQGNVIGSMGVSRDITELKEAEQQLIESEEKYRDLFENATDLIQSVDITGEILYVNEAWKKTLGYNDKDILNKNIFEFIHPDCQEKCQFIFSDLINKPPKKPIKISYEFISKSKEKIVVEGNVSLKLQNRKPHSTRAILRDVTKEQWENTKQNVYNEIAKIISEKINSEDIYESIRQALSKVMNTDVFVLSYCLDNDIITFPYYYDKSSGKGRVIKPDRLKGEGINEYFLKQKSAKILKRKDLDKIINKGGYKLLGVKAQCFVGVPLKIKNTTIGVLSVQSYVNKNEYNEKSLEILEFISGAVALAVQRKYDEAKIHDQSARLEAIIENSTHLFWTFNKELGLTTFNKNFKNYVNDSYEKKAKTNLYRKDNKTRMADKKDHAFWDEKYAEAYKGKQQHFIIDKFDVKQQRVVKEVFLNPIKNDSGETTEISGIAHDITEKIIAEEQLKDSLKQKEVLLKEVHHRVKNNLQVISSILNLQTSYVKDEKTLTILKESQNRIKSMSFIHESLYQTNDFSQINFSEYVISLSKNLVHSYGVFDGLVDLDLKIENVSLNLDQSIPCGLLINELVSNALKYAFPKEKRGSITIELLEKKGTVYLAVKDNGVGLPNDIDYRNTDSLGLQLVITLIEQLDGEIKLDNNQGANYYIQFKKLQ